MATFNATIYPIADAMLSQVIQARADISAADAASVGSYHVFFMISKQNPDGTWASLAEAEPTGVMVNLTQAPQTSYWSYTPASLGVYKIDVSVRAASWAWQTVNRSPVQFTMQPIPTVNGFKYYVPVAPPPPEVGVVPLVKRADGSYLPITGNWQMIPGMSIVDNSVLDQTKWYRKFWNSYAPFTDHFGDELERYIDSAVDYQNGAMTLTATPRAGTSGHAPSPNGDQYPLFDSGMVRSVATSQFFFSHLQIVLPKAPGVWPAWWIIPSDGKVDPNPEMDMLEFVYNGANEKANMIHCNCSANKALLWHDARYNTQFGYLQPDPTFYDADYWVNRPNNLPVDICILWSEDSTMTLYHDGLPTAKWYFPWYYRGGVAVPATMMLNFAIGGTWPTSSFTLPVPSGPVVTTVNFLKTYSKITSKYGQASPA